MGLNYINFVKRLMVFTVILGAIGLGITYLIPAEFVTPTLPFLYLFFFQPPGSFITFC